MVPVRNTAYAMVIHPSRPIQKRGSGASAASAGQNASHPGLVTILVPRFKGRLGKGFVKTIGIRPDINVNLDAYGSFIYLRIDGRRTVRNIGEELKRVFDDSVEPLYGRLANFLGILESSNLISIKPGEQTSQLPKKN